jgi:hypothetical protein
MATSQLDGKTATAEYGHYSRKVWVEFSAEQEVQLPGSDKQVLYEEPFLYNTTSTFYLKTPLKPQVTIEYEYEGNRRTIGLDKRQSKDGVLRWAEEPEDDKKLTPDSPGFRGKILDR